MSSKILERMRQSASVNVDTGNREVVRFLRKNASPRRSAGDVGLELEIEGRNLPSFIRTLSPELAIGWKAEKDGSLRGENHEYITNGPIKMAEVEPMLAGLWNAFKEKGSKLKLSNRCSTHVHVNCSMLTPKPITSFIALYGMVEEAVTYWCGQDRVSNPFCLRMCDTPATIREWTKRLRGDMAEFGNGMKYNALNLKPLFMMGSVEFRSLRAVEDYTVILKWVRFLWALREEARTTYQNPARLAQEVSARGALGVIEAIIAKHDLEEFWQEVRADPDNGPKLERSVRNGFLMVQPLLFCVDWSLSPDKEEAGEVEDNPYAEAEKAQREAEHQFLMDHPALLEDDEDFERPRAVRAGRARMPDPVDPVRLDPFVEAPAARRAREENEIQQLVNEMRQRDINEMPAPPAAAAPAQWAVAGDEEEAADMDEPDQEFERDPFDEEEE